MTARLVFLLICAATLAGAASDYSTDDYRMDNYRAPTPETLPGATVLTTEQAQAVWENHQGIFIDVLPRPPRPPNLPAATIWRPKPRFDIPGSIWLPDTGYGALAPVMEAYFEHGLTKASAGDKNHLLVFYCLKDCWMSWNAARRALSLGYTQIDWYPDGTDGWQAQGLPTEPRDPVGQPPATE